MFRCFPSTTFIRYFDHFLVLVRTGKSYCAPKLDHWMGCWNYTEAGTRATEPCPPIPGFDYLRELFIQIFVFNIKLINKHLLKSYINTLILSIIKIKLLISVYWTFFWNWQFKRGRSTPPPPTHPMHTHKDLKMPRLILFLKIVISTFKENYTDNFNFFNQ